MLAVLVIVPLALANAGELDASFGDGGLVELPAGDRYAAVDAPLVQPSGRIVAAGLLKNASDRVFLYAVTPDGVVDPTFGTGGEIHTNSVAPGRMAATALAPGGDILVAGGSNSNGRITVERFKADGARDTTWGSSGRVTANLGGSYARPTAIAVGQEDGAVFVAAENAASGKPVFTVAKVNASGLVASFGTNGIARPALAGKAATALDLAMLGSGKLLLAGSVQPNGNAAGLNTGLARLHPNGTPDNAFGSKGVVSHDLAGNTEDDFAAALAAGESYLVAGPAGGGGMVARLNPDGSLDGGFGSGGSVLGGLAVPGASFLPADVAVDAGARPIVVGTSVSGSPATHAWTAVRLTPNAQPVLDTSFGEGGRVVVEQCSNTVGAGPTGLALDDSGILILGGCESTSRTALARLLGGGGPAVGPVELALEPDREAAGHERIPLAGLDPSAALDAAAGVQATALRRTALRRTALRRTDILSTALRRTALRRTGLMATALRRTALRRTLLSEIALRRTSWEELLGTAAPLQTLTLEDAIALNPDGVGALTLDDIDLNSTALRRTSMASFVLGTAPLAALPAPEGGWCAYLAAQPYNCSNGVAEATTTLLELELMEDDLSEYLSEPISLREVDLGTGEDAAPIAGFLLRELDLSVEPFRGAEASELSSILACGSACPGKLSDLSEEELGDATVAQLVGLLPKPSLEDLSVGDVLLAMLDKAEIPYEALALPGLLGEAGFRDDDLLTYTATFSLDCGQVDRLRAVFTAPGDARPVPGGATLALDGGPERDLGAVEPAEGKQGPFTISLTPGCQGTTGSHQATLRLLVEPGSALGPVEGGQLVIEEGSDEVESNSLAAFVDDSRDPGDELEDARPIDTDALLTGHLAHASDLDSFDFVPDEGRTTISLSHLPADYDLVVYGPAVGPDATALRRTALRRTALRRTPVGDQGEEPLDEAVVAPDQVQDIALRRTDLSVRATSINRGESDEAASIVVGPGEAGSTFTAQVIGYNGASSAEPYVIRRTDVPAAPAPDCPGRALQGEGALDWPAEIPAATKALYLVDPGRMAARDGAAPTQAMLGDLADLAAETDGVVLPVQDNPRVGTAAEFAAWDVDPCSPERANDVVTAINEVVDDAIAEGGGLPELRSIVVVGPDEVIPQARVEDNTVIGNESDYADDAIVDRNGDGVRDDNTISSALRQGYMLSDDPYGDFDPTTSSFVPDVALGRLVETPAQVQAQIQAFLDSNGIVNPERSYVSGYDFLSDGAEEIHGSLSAAVGDGAAESRIDETWTAADAIAGIDAEGPGYLSVNAHYDHYRALPADAFNGLTPNLLGAAETSAPAGSVAFTLGCHGGLNLAVGDASQGSHPRLGDWVDRMVTQGALYAANTGFGYGDDTAVAYSERVMADYAAALTSGDVTAGQALMLAKQGAYASVGVADVYWTKASMEATFYGLPMYRVGEEGAEGPATLPAATPAGVAADAGEPTRASTPFSVDLRERLHARTDERGTWWQVDDEPPLVVQRRPIQPKLTADVTDATAGPAHGFLLEELTTTDILDVDPAIARATIDLAEHEPEPENADPFFPATLATVESQATAEGLRDMLTLMAGSFRGDRQRLNLEMGGRVLRSTSDDYEPPTVRRVDGLVQDGGFSIRVEADGGDLLGGTVLFLTDADKEEGGELEWRRSDLSLIAPGVLSTGGALPSGTSIPEAVVQVYDRSHNVATSSHKVEGHTFSPLAEPAEGDPQVVLDPPVPASGYYAQPPQISLDKGEHQDAAFEVSVDGGAWEPFEGAFTVAEPAEGEHLVTFRGSDGAHATARFAVDREGPDIIAEPDRPAGEHGWYDGPVTFTFLCADAVSGPAGCPEPVTLSGPGQNQSFSVSATDRAGHSSSLTVSGINIDTGDPGISAQTLTQPNQYGWYNTAGVVVRFSCTDDLSGLVHCGGRDVDGAPLTATDQVTFTDEGRDQRVSGVARDRSGRTAVAESPPVSIDRTDPEVAFTTSNGALLIGSASRVQGTAFDALSGVRSVRITYTSVIGHGHSTRTVTREADSIECDSAGNCTWTVPPAPFGVWRAEVTATDFAGNQATAAAKIVLTIT